MTNSEKTDQPAKGTWLCLWKWTRIVLPIVSNVLLIVVLVIVVIGFFNHNFISCSEKERAKSTERTLRINSKTGTISYESKDTFYQPPSSNEEKTALDEAPPSVGKNKEVFKEQVTDGPTNIALNKPVVELFLNVRKVGDSDKELNENQLLLQFDTPRLKSHVRYYEQYTVNAGRYPSHLTDGDHDTAAAPADFAFDYVVDLKGKYRLSEIVIDWGSSGTPVEKENHITEWELYGQTSFSDKTFPRMEDWELIIKGEIPGQRITKIPEQHFKKPVKRLRIRAKSEAKDNRRAGWIGIHEMEVYGDPWESGSSQKQ